jgi:hypothetical protein
MTATFLYAMLGPPSDDEDEGWSISLNPYSPDLGKLRFGRRRIDVMGGLSQSTRFMTRLSTNIVNGVLKVLGKEPSKQADREMRKTGSIIGRFMASKLAPAPGLLGHVAEGETYEGKPMTWWRLGYQAVTPLSLREIYESMTEFGVPGGVALSVLAIFGFGGMTYEDKPKQTARPKALRPLRPL